MPRKQTNHIVHNNLRWSQQIGSFQNPFVEIVKCDVGDTGHALYEEVKVNDKEVQLQACKTIYAYSNQCNGDAEDQGQSRVLVIFGLNNGGSAPCLHNVSMH